MDGDLSHAESRRGGEFFSRKERIDRKGWKRVRLGDVGYVYGGLTGKSKEHFGKGNAKYITFLNVLSNTVIDTSALQDVIVSSDEHQNAVKDGDLFFNNSSETPEEVGMCACLENDLQETYLNSFCFGFRPTINNVLWPRFAAILFNSVYGRKKMSILAQGATRYNLSKEQFLNLKIEIPSYVEQKHIASTLSTFDDYTGLLQSLIAKYEAIKKATVNLLLKPKAGWQRIRLDDCCMCLDNMRKPVNEEMRQSMKGDIPYCGANGIVDYVNDYTINDSVILIAEDGGYFDEYQTRSIAYMIIGKAWVNNHAHILKVKNGYCQDYIFHTLEHKNIVPFITSGTRAKLTKRELLNIEINAPESVYEQRKIAAQISAIDNALNDCRAQLAKAQSLKQGMMSYFFG